LTKFLKVSLFKPHYLIALGRATSSGSLTHAPDAAAVADAELVKSEDWYDEYVSVAGDE